MVESKDLDLSKLAGARFIVKNKDKSRIPELISPRDEKAHITGHVDSVSGLKGHTRVFVKVQDGCDNACSYCKVRIVRGRSRSRMPEAVIRECETLIKNGSREIVLTGICLGSYGRDIDKGISLAGLIKKICNIKGEWRLRLSSIEPKDVNDDLLRQIKIQDRLCKHIHMPFQSGDDHILKKMNRPYESRDYLDTAAKIRGAVPDAAISTDIMVGFPGETEERSQNTIAFINAVKPMRIHIFPFSKRKGTRAYDYGDIISDSVKRKREEVLGSLAEKLAMEFTNKFMGKEVRVLVESKSATNGLLRGYTDRYIKVSFEGPDSLKGEFANIRLTPATLLRI